MTIQKSLLALAICTPFLLAKIVEITGGSSLEANINLVYNNAAVGAEIAAEYSRLK